MYLFSKAQSISENQIYIPHFMRAALKIHEGSILTLSSEIRDSSPLQNQIIISETKRDFRSDYWNLKVSFRDRPGIVAELCTLLANVGIEILDCSMITRDQNNEFTVDIDFCARSYYSDFDSDTIARKNNPGQWPKELYTNILCSFIDEIIFRRDGKPLIYIKYNHVLSASVEDINFLNTCKINNGFVKFPAGALKTIRSQFALAYPHAQNRNVEALSVLSTDHEFNLIVATIYFPNTGYSHIRVHYLQTTHSLAEISSTLTEHGFNIVLLNSRNIKDGRRGMVDIFMHLPSEIDKNKDDEKLKRWIHAIFTGAKLKHAKCQVVFPTPFSREDMKIDSARHVIDGE